MTLALPSYAQFDPTSPAVWVEQNPDVGRSVSALSGWLAGQWDRLRWYDAYYEGEQPLSYMSKAMETEVGTLVRTVILNWPRVVADAYLARMRVEGFRYAGDEETDAELWKVWQSNNLDKLFRQALLEMLALGRAYVIVGSADRPGGLPVVTVESPFQVMARRDPRTRKVAEAVKLWQDAQNVSHATLYQPNRTVVLRSEGGRWVPISVDPHNLGVVPVVPLVNRGRITRPEGLSEFHDVIPIVDAAIKAATDMMISSEYHAMPRRWVFGLKRGDFKDQNGNEVGMWSRIAGRIWSAETKDVNVGQFNESSLTNFHETIKLLAQLASQVSALPANMLAFNAVNPASAEALRALDAQLEMRVDGKIVDNGEDAEDIMRLVLRFQTGQWDEKAQSLESVWADPGISTMAQKADAAVKLVQARDAQGRSIMPIEQAREFVGFGPIARDRMRKADEDSANDPVIASLAKTLAAPVAPPAISAPA